MFVTEFTKTGEVNTDVLKADLITAVASVEGIGVRPGIVIVNSTADLSGTEQTTLQGIIAVHDGSILSQSQQNSATGAALLRDYLNNNMPDLKYADYFFRLQKKLHDCWRLPRPILADRIVLVITALKGNKDTDINHADMWNTFLDFVVVEYGATVSAGEIVFSGTAPQQAAQARVVLNASRIFMLEGLAMINMLLANRIL